MTDPVNYAQITVTSLDDGSTQYDIIPHDKTEEGAMVLFDKDGFLSIRDEDGLYQPIAGTQNISISEYEDFGLVFELDLGDTQRFEDLENGVSIELSRDGTGSLVVEVETGNDSRTQYIGAVPESNKGYEQRTLIIDNQIGSADTATSPGGLAQQDIPPSFKI